MKTSATEGRPLPRRPDIRRVKIYGERNTGTHFLRSLVGLNLDLDILPGIVPQPIQALRRDFPGSELFRDVYFAKTFHRNLGWKHRLVDVDELERTPRGGQGTGYLTITKNPYSWLLSLYRRPYHQHLTEWPALSEFLTRPWKVVAREGAEADFTTPVEVWNRKNAAYIALSRRLPTVNVTYEALLKDPGRIIERIGDEFGQPLVGGRFRNESDVVKDGGRRFDYYRQYYLSEAWMEELPDEAVDIINRLIDEDIVRHFGYERLER